MRLPRTARSDSKPTRDSFKNFSNCRKSSRFNKIKIEIRISHGKLKLKLETRRDIFRPHQRTSLIPKTKGEDFFGLVILRRIDT